MILEAADGFLFVVACDTGSIIYVSDSVTPVLNQSQADWFGANIYDQLHPEDVEKVRRRRAGEGRGRGPGAGWREWIDRELDRDTWTE